MQMVNVRHSWPDIDIDRPYHRIMFKKNMKKKMQHNEEEGIHLFLTEIDSKNIECKRQDERDNQSHN